VPLSFINSWMKYFILRVNFRSIRLLCTHAHFRKTFSRPYQRVLLFSYQTGYIMWHSRLMLYIPFGSGNIDHKPGMSHYISCLIAE
jgi:hypothetical protein